MKAHETCADHTVKAELHCSLTKNFEVRSAPGLSRGQWPDLGAVIGGRRLLIVTSPTVDRIYGAQLRELLQAQRLDFAYRIFSADERTKNLAMVEQICRSALEAGVDRKGALVAFGGGICSDLVALSAALIRRGVDHVRIPTTLIGQVDAGIGIKGGVNFEGRKSFLGCFHPPAAVLIDRAYLATVSADQIRHGLSEILKMTLIMDRPLFDMLSAAAPALIASRFQQPDATAQQVLDRSIQLMLGELQQNPYEIGARERLADMGHTFSPALEVQSNFRLSHGEAVSIDMALSCMIAETLGMMAESEAEEFIALLARIGLPINSPFLTIDLCRKAVGDAIAHRAGRLNLVVPTKIGDATYLGADAISTDLLVAALAKLAALQDALAHSSFDTPRRVPIRTELAAELMSH